MKKLFLRSAVLLMALCCISAGVANAALLTTNVPFIAAGNSYSSATDGSGTIGSGGQTGFMWTTGDYVKSSAFSVQTFAIVGLSVSWYYQNYLGGATETWYVYINNTPVAAFVAPDDSYNGNTYYVTGSVSWAPWYVPQASSYTLSIVLQNTVGFGGGSVSFLDGGSTTISYTPEPGTLVLFGSSALGLAGMLRRKLGV